MTATLINNKTGEEIKVRSTANHPSSSYGKEVWVDDDNKAYMQVGLEKYNPLYDIVLDEPYRTRRRIGERIAALRKSKGLTVRQLADMTGINISNISRIENGETSPTVDTLNRLTQALDTEISL